MQKIIILTLVACLLPYIFALIAKILGRFSRQDNRNPREFLANLHGKAARANATQLNSFEGLPMLIAGVGFAVYNLAPESLIIYLLQMYLVFRIIFAFCYIYDWSILRSVVWFLALFSNIMLFVLAYLVY